MHILNDISYYAHVYRNINIFMSSALSSTLTLNPRMPQIGFRSSETEKCSQRYQNGHFGYGFFSCIQPSEIPIEIPLEIPPEMHLEILLEISPEYLLKCITKYIVIMKFTVEA